MKINQMVRMSAFTLVELLVVVAIIAILAAIAVPNFQESQVRTKISRTMADMNATSLAITSYRVDHNQLFALHAPGHFWSDRLMVYGMRNTNGNSNGTGRWNGSLLTTPVAYVSSIPVDLFNTSLQKVNGNSGSIYALPGYSWSYFASVEMDGFRTQQMGAFQSVFAQQGRIFSRPIKWILESAGPDGTWWVDNGRPQNANRFFYDPTNGTVSEGQIALCDQGWLTPSK